MATAWALPPRSEQKRGLARLSVENCTIHPAEILEKFQTRYCECATSHGDDGFAQVDCPTCQAPPNEWPHRLQRLLVLARRHLPRWRAAALRELL